MTSTSPAESERTTSTVPAAPGPRRGRRPSAARRRIRSTAAARSAATAGAAATSSGRVTAVGTRMPAAPAAAAAADVPADVADHHAAVRAWCPARRRRPWTRPGAGLRQRAAGGVVVRADLPGVERAEQLLDPGVDRVELRRR